MVRVLPMIPFLSFKCQSNVKYGYDSRTIKNRKQHKNLPVSKRNKIYLTHEKCIQAETYGVFDMIFDEGEKKNKKKKQINTEQ